MFFSIYILSLFGYDFTIMSCERLKTLLHRMSLIGIEGRILLSTKEALYGINGSEPHVARDSFFATSFVSKNFRYNGTVMKAINNDTISYLNSKSEPASTLLFGDDIFFSLELTQNIRYLSAYPLLFGEMLYTLGIPYDQAILCIDKMVKRAQSNASVVLQSSRRHIRIKSNVLLNK